jgi:hypothetical protein
VYVLFDVLATVTLVFDDTETGAASVLAAD